MKKLFFSIGLVLASCTSAGEAERGSIALLKQLGIEYAAIACVGTIDDPTNNHSTCTVKTKSGDVLVTHCQFMGCSNGCTMQRPGMSN